MAVYALILLDVEDLDIIDSWGPFATKRAAKKRAEELNKDYYLDVARSEGDCLNLKYYDKLDWCDGTAESDCGNYYTIIKLRQ